MCIRDSLLALGLPAQQTGHSLWPRRDYEQYDLAVFYVQGVGCPIARIALPNYREVRDEYVSENIAFTMFNSNIQDNLARIAKEADEFGIDFPIMKDEGQKLAKALGVERTAEAFVFNPKTKEVLFRGPINDQLGYETQRNSASNWYLKDALNTILAGKQINICLLYTSPSPRD